MVNTKQRGFTLFEVLISMFIAGVAVLGLVMLELNILRSSQSSFNYTLATIEANTLVDKVWRNLCVLETGASPAVLYENLYLNWKSGLENPNINDTKFYGKSIKASGLAPEIFTHNDTVEVKWNDKNFEAVADNDKVTLLVNYPDLTGKCI